MIKKIIAIISALTLFTASIMAIVQNAWSFDIVKETYRQLPLGTSSATYQYLDGLKTIYLVSIIVLAVFSGWLIVKAAIFIFSDIEERYHLFSYTSLIYFVISIFTSIAFLSTYQKYTGEDSSSLLSVIGIILAASSIITSLIAIVLKSKDVSDLYVYISIGVSYLLWLIISILNLLALDFSSAEPISIATIALELSSSVLVLVFIVSSIIKDSSPGYKIIKHK